MKKIRTGKLQLSCETIQQLTPTSLDLVHGGILTIGPLPGSAGSLCPSIQLHCPGSGGATCTVTCPQKP